MSKETLIDIPRSIDKGAKQVLQVKRVIEEQDLQTKSAIENITSDFENAKREIEITNRQIELHQASTEKSIEAIDHCLKVGRIAETAGFIFIGLCIVSAFFGRPAIVIIFGLLANVSIWGAVGYDSFMNHQDNKRQAEVDRQIAELEKQKEGD